METPLHTVKSIATLGHHLMRRAKISPHFYRGHSLYHNALYLTYFSLGLPYDFNNPSYLSRPLTAQETAAIMALFQRRISERLPVEYITHEAYYLGRSFYVNKNVLIPRSLMSTRFKDFLQGITWKNYRVLDLCAGSGCIGITLAHLHPQITVDLADISSQALVVAAINIKKHGLQSRVQCIQSDLFANIKDRYDLIITNPPYVPESEYLGQPQEVKQEPELALTSGKEGLDLIHKILAQSKSYLNPQGKLIAEVGYTAAKKLKRKYPKTPFEWYVCRSKWLDRENIREDESLFDVCMSKLFGTDSILVCPASALSASGPASCG